jgi:threonine dehydrogenase-like Zn-dependent dehydrogenase
VEALPQACGLVRDGGRIVVAGYYTDAGDSVLNVHLQLNRKHAEILGCWGSSYAHLARAVDALAAFGDDAPWNDMITHRFRLDEADRALEVVARGESIKALMLPVTAG